MVRRIFTIVGLISAAEGASIVLIANGTITSSGSFAASAGQSVTLTIQYDDSTVSSLIGGVGTVFDSPITISLATTTAYWHGTNPAPLDYSILFNAEAIETAVIFRVPNAGAGFGTNPPGLLPDSMILEITGLSPWFTGSDLADLASADFRTAQFARFTLSATGQTTPLVADMDLNSFQVVPEPRTAVFLTLGVMWIYRRNHRNSQRR